MRWFKSPISSPISAFNFRLHVLDGRQVGIIFPDRTNFNIFQKDEKTYSINSSIKTKIMTSKRLRNYFTWFSKWKKYERSHQHDDCAGASSWQYLKSATNNTFTFIRCYWLDHPSSSPSQLFWNPNFESLKFLHHPQNPKIFWKIFLNFLKINNYGASRSFLVILCEFRPFWTNLYQNGWQKIEKIDCIKKYYWPLGGATLKFLWSEVLS